MNFRLRVKSFLTIRTRFEDTEKCRDCKCSTCSVGGQVRAKCCSSYFFVLKSLMTFYSQDKLQ